LAFYSGFDQKLLEVVKWAGIALLCLCLLVFILVLILRARLLAQEKRRQEFLSIWQPILTRSISVATSDVPNLQRRDLSNFLLVWNHLQESLLDESKDHLNQIAKALRIGRVALKMLRHRNLRDRMLAIVTLGHLRARSAWNPLLEIMEKGTSVLSIAAARALMMIDAEKATPLLIPLLATRSDWPASRVATMLRAAGADVFSEQLAKAAVTASLEQTNESVDAEARAIGVEQSLRLIRYLELAYTIEALPAARTIAESSREPEILAACLRLFKSAEDAQIVRRFIAHDDWRVRVQAASALGRFGEAEDESLLVPLLSDREWWVRYRAGQALSRLPFMRISRLKEIKSEQSDRYARDMIDQVMAEIALQ